MPELPEVENLRRGLEKNIVGQKVIKVKVNKPKLVSGKGNIRVASTKKVQEFERGLKGESFLNIVRRAKNLIFRFKSGKLMLVHLKMSGQFVYETKTHQTKVSGGHPIELSERELPNKHTHVIFELENGTLYYNDTRMFGYLLYYPSAEMFEKENHFALYGLEPFDTHRRQGFGGQEKFTVKYLEGGLKKRHGKIKSVLMSQKVVVGLGNIYADETLFESKIKPTRAASSLKPAEVVALYKAIGRIMKRATHVGGSSVATYRLLDQTRGNYAREHKVYGKSGKPCPRCGHPLKTILLNNRTTVYCSNCQL